MSAPAERLRPGVSTPSVDSSLGTELLPTLLSIIAGSVDAIGFLGLGGLFTAHVTGNLVILAGHLAGGVAAAVGREVIGCPSLGPLLLLQLLLLAGFLVRSVSAGPRIDPDAPIAILAGML